jgi:anti-sigma regulatory factor (Ser/Thr protein kinase)/CheY-like chemotaxis protein
LVRQVLLLDTRPETASRRAEAVRSLGYHVWSCTTGEEAWAYAQRRLPDAVLIASAESPAPSETLCEAPSETLIERLRLNPRTNPLGLILAGSPPVSGLIVEPDAYLLAPEQRSALLEAVATALAQAERRRAHLLRSEVCWRLESSPEVLERFAAPFTRWAESCGLSGHAVRQLGSAVRELCANAMEWGNHFCPEFPVSVTARLDEEKVSVLVRDTGPGFDRRHLPHAARYGDPLSHLSVRAAANLREGGFGILMASGLVDQLAYNERGNEALAVKYLPQSHTHPLRHLPGSLLASG